MAIPMLGLEDIVGKRFESCEIDVVEELREGKGGFIRYISNRRYHARWW